MATKLGSTNLAHPGEKARAFNKRMKALQDEMSITSSQVPQKPETPPISPSTTIMRRRAMKPLQQGDLFSVKMAAANDKPEKED